MIFITITSIIFKALVMAGALFILRHPLETVGQFDTLLILFIAAYLFHLIVEDIVYINEEWEEPDHDQD